ncbi:MAG: DUF2281 domain-containing protein [Candidatus Thermoplasmatota archaeon]|nr:DUF2281 domain-containing protein [Candidatus Thermoplasmatota archaeon]
MIDLIEMESSDIEAMIDELPEDLRNEVLDYIELLIKKNRDLSVEKDRFKFEWEGALYDLRDRFTSVELQHHASEWR